MGATPTGMRSRARAALWALLVALGLASPMGHAADAPPAGFVYKVSSPDSQAVLYLYGTLHVGSARSAELDPATRELVAHSARLALELDPRNAAALGHALQTYAVYPPGDSLSKHVPADLMARTSKRAEALKLPDARVDQMRPWVAANLLAVLTLASSGLDPRLGSETLLSAEAQRAGVPVVEIEGADTQFKLLGGAPEATQVDALRRTLDGLDDGRIATEARQLLDAWSAGDGAAIETMLADLNQEPGLFPQFMATQLIAARDSSMADSAVEDLNAGGTTFFAVGALHLFGTNGLINQLKKRGYAVTALR
jgi:uncharacterized protein